MSLFPKKVECSFKVNFSDIQISLKGFTPVGLVLGSTPFVDRPHTQQWLLRGSDQAHSWLYKSLLQAAMGAPEGQIGLMFNYFTLVTLIFLEALEIVWNEGQQLLQPCSFAQNEAGGITIKKKDMCLHTDAGLASSI